MQMVCLVCLVCRASRHVWLIAALAVVTLIVATGMRGLMDGPPDSESEGDVQGNDAAAQPAGEPVPKFPVTIRRPSGPPLIELKQADPLGRVGRVTCSTCHSLRPPDLAHQSPSDLDEFHQDMKFSHGNLGCYSCHNPDDSDTLRLADGNPLTYSDVMTQCAQCHGSQAREFANGAHGGMTGYWDLSRGGRARNNCIDCHDPHVPKFPSMQPTFEPRDRFLTPSHHVESDGKVDH